MTAFFLLKNCPWAEKTATPCLCLLDDLSMATPAWPTPMRALLISKFQPVVVNLKVCCELGDVPHTHPK